MDRNSDDETRAHADVVALARRHLGAGTMVFYPPSIPPEKEAAARLVHARYLPEAEPILALYDSTVFGSAEDGFLITPRRLCWRNLWEQPRQLAWDALDASTVAPLAGKIRVAGGEVNAVDDLVSGAALLFAAMATRGRAGDRGPYRAGGTIEDGAPLSIARLVALARAALGEVSDVYFHPSIPAAKEQRARAVHAAHLPASEPLAVLYDDTLFGSAEEGFLLTRERVCWKTLSDAPVMLAWSGVDPRTISAVGNRVRVGESAIEFTSRLELVEPAAALLRRAVEEARGAPGAP